MTYVPTQDAPNALNKDKKEAWEAGFAARRRGQVEEAPLWARAAGVGFSWLDGWRSAHRAEEAGR